MNEDGAYVKLLEYNNRRWQQECQVFTYTLRTIYPSWEKRKSKDPDLWVSLPAPTSDDYRKVFFLFLIFWRLAKKSPGTGGGKVDGPLPPKPTHMMWIHTIYICIQRRHCPILYIEDPRHLTHFISFPVFFLIFKERKVNYAVRTSLGLCAV